MSGAVAGVVSAMASMLAETSLSRLQLSSDHVGPPPVSFPQYFNVAKHGVPMASVLGGMIVVRAHVFYAWANPE